MTGEQHAKPEASAASAALQKAHQQYVASGGKPMTNDHPESNPQFDHFKYYLMGDTVPVRFSAAKDGGFFDAERPGEQKGSLVRDISLIFKRDKPFSEFEEIGKAEFDQRLRDYVRRAPVIDSKGQGR